MTRPLRLAAILLSLAPAVRAQEAAVLAEYWTNNGSLPPQYAWQTGVTIRADGSLTLTHCKGYQEGPACTTRHGRVPTEALTSITAAAEASGLAGDPARETEMPIVGGGQTGGRVVLEEGEALLIPQPAEADAARVAGVLSAIRAAIPARLHRFLQD